jgi:hypothetical protein
VRRRGIQGQQLLSLSHIHFFNLLGIGMTFPFLNKKTRNVRARFEKKKKKRALGDWVVRWRWQASALSDFASTPPQHDEERGPPHVTPNLFFQRPSHLPPSARSASGVVHVSHSVPLSLVNHRPRDTRGKRGRGGRNEVHVSSRVAALLAHS